MKMTPGSSNDGGIEISDNDRFEAAPPEEIPPEILSRRICDFKLRIEGGPLEAIIVRFQKELSECGITKLKPQFYLSDEWGVMDGSVAIALPFYLADDKLRRIQERKAGLVEGIDAEDILRYLRHEMGHVVNYAYMLYETEPWIGLFGPMARPYADEYRSVPFSPDFVRHLPGNYAQKHPDDDWAETFAVWMTPGHAWKNLYEDAPGALRKLHFCEKTIASLQDREPAVTNVNLDGKVDDLSVTLQDFYGGVELEGLSIPRSLDGDLRGIFAPWAGIERTLTKMRLGSGAALLSRNRDMLANTVYQWTGVEPELLGSLLTHLAVRAKDLGLSYPMSERDTVLVQISAFLSTLAMNYVYKGNFFAS